MWPELRTKDWIGTVQDVFNLDKPPKWGEHHYLLAKNMCYKERKKLPGVMTYQKHSSDYKRLKEILSKFTMWPDLRVKDWIGTVQDVFNLDKPPKSLGYHYNLAYQMCYQERKKRA